MLGQYNLVFCWGFGLFRKASLFDCSNKLVPFTNERDPRVPVSGCGVVRLSSPCPTFVFSFSFSFRQTVIKIARYFPVEKKLVVKKRFTFLIPQFLIKRGYEAHLRCSMLD